LREALFGVYDLSLSRLPRYDFDRAYVDRLIAEDPETEQHFTRYFGDLLTLKLRSRVRSTAQLEDAKQETFVRVLATLKQKGGIASPEALGAFVNSVCSNVVFELYRSGSRLTALDEGHDEADEGRDVEATLMAAEEQTRVRAVLADLPQKDQEVLRLLFFDDRDKDTVCQELNVDRNYLRVLLHRAKTHFRDRFADEGSH
jgi:RNA polymerase sigma-70 factor, ECF subfamily